MVLQSILYFFIEKKYPTVATRKEETVLVIDEKHLGLPAIFSALVEYGILNRYSFFGYKNSVRSNAKLCASFLTSSLILILFFVLFALLSGSDICPLVSTKEIILGWGGFLVSSFTIERKILYDKWQYLASLYNNIIGKPTNAPERNALNIALAIDLLDMEMWSHRSFRDFFYDTMIEAVEFDMKQKERKVSFDTENIRKKAVSKEHIRMLFDQLQNEFF